jgi:adenylosuccinate synthase
LAAVREQVQKDLGDVIQGEFLFEDREAVEEKIDLLYDDDFLDYVAKRFSKAGREVNIVDPDFLGREIISKDGVAVVESSHGILSDHFHGFYPHVSAIRTLPCFTHAMLKEAGYNGQIVNIGVSRAYQISHGPRPMPTEDPTMTENLLPGSHVDNNRYRGKVRVGPLDFNLLRYAIEVCGGPTAFDGLAITWFDQIEKNGKWHVCDHYLGADDQTYFSPSGKIKVRHGTDDEQLKYQEALGKKLLKCVPEITTYEISSDAEQDKLYALCADVLKEKISVPVRMVSFGPTELDKICK